MIQRNRALVRYIWLCLELEEYDCMLCAPSTRATMQMGYRDDCLIIKAFRERFSTLSAWKPNGNLLLDISIHSPSDSEHRFEYLTLLPDIPSDKCDRNIWENQSMLAKLEAPSTVGLLAVKFAFRQVWVSTRLSKRSWEEVRSIMMNRKMNGGATCHQFQ